jgi:hypothetical protein
MTCPQCRPGTGPDAAFCRSCGTSAGSEPPGWTYPFDGRPFPAASVSQFPRTPGDQYIPSAAAGQHGPLAVAPPREFRLDPRRLSRCDQAVGGASLVVLIALFLPWFGFSAPGASVSGTTAHGYLVLVVITALLIAGYLLLRSGWGEFPFTLPVAHETLLLAATGGQFLLVLAGFLDVPLAGLGWEIGAYLAVAAAALATLPAALAARRSRPRR